MQSQYYNNWWNHNDDWKKNPQVMVDQEKAFTWHLQKVSLNIYQMPFLLTSPNCSTAAFGDEHGHILPLENAIFHLPTTAIM
jgi:hypothetical protein